MRNFCTTTACNTSDRCAKTYPPITKKSANVYVFLLSLLFFTCLLSPAVTYANYSLISTTENSFSLIDEEETPLISFAPLHFKPNWTWLGNEQIKQTTQEKTTSYLYDIDNNNIRWGLNFSEEESMLLISSQLLAKKDTPLTYLSFSMKLEPALDNGQLILNSDHDKNKILPFPLGIYEAKNINEITIENEEGDVRFTFSFSPSVDIHIHHGLRIKLADQKIIQQMPIEHSIEVTSTQKINFFDDIKSLKNNTKHDNWFAFTPKKVTKNGAIGMQEWLSTPLSPLKPKNEFIYQGSNIHKIWGTNVEYSYNAPKNREAEKRAKFFAKYGINSVRLHKLSNPGWEGLGSEFSTTEYDKEKLKRFDYWTYQLKKQGITYGFSPIWDLSIRREDRTRILAYNEIAKHRPNKPITTGLVWFAEDIQQLHIETLVNLINRKNLYTKLSYTEDPALAYIEIQNEENAFFYTFINTIRQYPTYHRLLAKQFSDWLIKKYKNHRILVANWGIGAIDTFKNEGGLANEHLRKRNITPVVHPWFYDNQATQGRRAKRLQDSAQFLFEKQQEYYAKVTQAIRATGYKGAIVSGNWQAGSKGAHFLNLMSDAEFDIVDRHNYQGGAIGSPGHIMRTGFGLNNSTMLDNPGSYMLSLGMQQVANKPFMVSEWLSVLPSEWAAADTAIMAAYGFGLQGWDASYHFTSNGAGFTKTLANGENKFNNLTPIGVGLYPILSRMVLRGDISEAKTIATRRLNQKQAISNSYDFDNTVEQQHDNKSFSGTPHHNALAAGKVLIEFTEQAGKSTIDDWQKTYKKSHANGHTTIHSTTGELSWHYSPEHSQKGLVEVNSAGTQGIIGFAKPDNYQLNDLSIKPYSPYSVILATAKSPNKVISNDDEVLVVAIARAHNTNMNLKKHFIANIGKAPIILEPVKATLRFKRQKGTVQVLDHDGVRTGKSYPLQEGVFELDTKRDKTIYYQVSFDK